MKARSMHLLSLARLYASGSHGNLRDIVFVHIPKTAGTSLHRVLIRSRYNTAILRDYAEDSRYTSPAIRRTVYGDPPAGARALRAEIGPDRPITLMGHFPAGRYAEIAAPGSFVTFLRSPVERAISEYVHFRNKNGYTDTVRAFVEQRRNVQAQHMRGVPLEQWGFVGTAENYDEDIDRLARFTGLPFWPLRLNIGDYGREHAELLRDAGLRRFIEERNEEDLALYRQVVAEREFFTRMRERTPPAAGRIHLAARLAPDGAVVGEAVDGATGAALRVRLLAGEREIGHTTADRYRDELVGRFAPHGVGAFRFAPGIFGRRRGPLAVEAAGLRVPVAASAPATSVPVEE